MMSRRRLEFQEGWDYIQKGLTKLKRLLEGLPELQFNVEEKMNLYSTMYNMCTQRNDEDYPKQLYEKYKEAIEEYLTVTVLPSLIDKYDEFILRELVTRWDIHNVMIKWMSRFFSYLDRYFVVRDSLPSLQLVGMISFRELIYHNVHSSVKHAIIGLIGRDREGEKVDRGLLKNVMEIIVELGIGKTDYACDLETAMLEDTSAYYSHKAANWILKYSCPDYMKKIEDCLKTENEIFHHYLHGMSEVKLVETVETELLVVHANQLLGNEQSGCRALLRDEKVDDLFRICRLYHRIPQGLELVSNIFKQHITDEGLAIFNQAIETTNSQAENECRVDEQVLVRKVIELHEKYLAYLGFMNHSCFQKSLKEVFGILCNKTVADSSSAELLATFCNNILKKGGSEKLSDEAIEDTCEKVSKLLAYVDAKDLFAEFYRKKLARRLLFDMSDSEERERSTLTKIKQLYGGQFTSKMEGMIMDLTLARENQAQFKEYLSNHPVANSGVDFSVTVLTSGYWPTYKTSDLNLPVEMVRCVEIFTEYYDEKSQRRRLNWIYSLGNCNILGKFDSKKIEMVMSTYQAIVLLLFNDSDVLSYSEMKEQSNLGDDDLVRVLFTLSCGKYKILNKKPSTETVSPSDSFELNSKFTDKMRRIKIPLPPVKDRKKVVEDVDNDRRYAIDAAVVRIMKSRKILSHQELISESIDQLKHMFKPDVKLIKKRIADLIERDYLERDQKDSDMYRYIS